MGANTIYFLFGGPAASGGDFVNIDHIAGLNALGFDAKVYYAATDDRFGRFSVPTALPGTPVKPHDIVVVGENRAHFFDELRASNCIKVQHNQNPFLTLHGFNSIAALNVYPFAHIITVSDFSVRKLKEMGITHPISRVRPCLPAYFSPGTKRFQIAYSSRKRPLEAPFVMEYFRATSPQYADVPWIALQTETREKCAEVMGQSAIYAAFPHLEGLGLMNLEALASDCHVIGYVGHGGAEYATAGNGDWIAEGAHEDFAAKLRAACQRFINGESNPYSAEGQATAAQYARDIFEKELHDVWLSIMGENAHLYRK